MDKFDNYLYQYGLHDCKIDSTIYANKKIAFTFNSGVYNLNNLGNEINLTPKCTMIIELEDSYDSGVCEHIEINRISKKKIHEIDFDDFVVKIKKYKFDVDINYYSYFCNTVLLKGYIYKDKYEITISEIKNIEFVFS